MKGRKMPPLPLDSASSCERGVSDIIATILVTAMVVVLAAILYILVSGFIGSPNSQPNSVGFSLNGYSEEAATTPSAWGEGQACSMSSNCQVINFTMTSSSGVTTAEFGLKVTIPTGSSIGGWIAVLWSPNGGAPLATFNGTSGTWLGATTPASQLPIGDLNGDGLMLITGPGTTLSHSGDTLQAYATAGGSISGKIIL